MSSSAEKNISEGFSEVKEIVRCTSRVKFSPFVKSSDGLKNFKPLRLLPKKAHPPMQPQRDISTTVPTALEFNSLSQAMGRRHSEKLSLSLRELSSLESRRWEKEFELRLCLLFLILAQACKAVPLSIKYTSTASMETRVWLYQLEDPVLEGVPDDKYIE
uniref:Uncharacterized protein n=1 Tax=Glossina austeni TaxID=7395 RepID=A0A1A9V8K3_GLOAU